MRNFFNPDNMVFRFMGRLSDLMILNFLWIICSIPIFTIGASTTALYSVTLELAKENEDYIIKSFFKSFKKNFKNSTLLWLCILGISILLTVNCIFWPRFNSFLSYFVMAFVMFFIFLLLIISPYIFVILSISKLSIKHIIKKSFLLSMKHLPYSFVITLLGIVFLIASIMFPFVIILMLLIGFALESYISAYIFNVVLNKYYDNDTHNIFNNF